MRNGALAHASIGSIQFRHSSHIGPHTHSTVGWSAYLGLLLSCFRVQSPDHVSVSLADKVVPDAVRNNQRTWFQTRVRNKQNHVFVSDVI